MNLPKLAAGLVTVVVLAGCATAPQMPVAMAPAAIGTEAGRVGVLVTVADKPDTYFPGAGCLLCLATANVAHTTLNAYVPTLSRAEALEIKDSVVAAFGKRKLETVVIPADVKLDDLPKLGGPNLAPRDFSALKARYKIDRLMVVQISQLGFERNYAAYVPTGDAKAVVRGVGYMVNLNGNALEWYQPLAVLKGVDGKWDEPPSFPGLTNAYYQAIESARDAVVAPLK